VSGAAFNRMNGQTPSIYHGASLSALVKLGQQKGYRFLGCSLSGINASFVIEERAGNLEAVSVGDAFRRMPYRDHRMDSQKQYELVSSFPLIEV
jgi:hypothetical protein